MVTKKRDKSTTLIHYYKESDGRSQDVAEVIKDFSKSWQGAYIIGAVDCTAQAALCEKESVRETPLLKVYPPFPAPSMDYEGETSIKGLNQYMQRFIPARNIVEINFEGIEGYIKDKPSVPKAILFTDKKGIPTLFKALANNMEGKIFFAIARKEDEDLAKKYKITKYPQIILVKSNEKKPYVYEGELKYKEIFDYFNVHAETFVPGGDSESAASKSWMTETVPELHRLSADDICLKSENLCVIYLTEDKPQDQLLDTLKSVSRKMLNEGDRGASVKFMWLNKNEETAFFNVFGVTSTPTIAVLKTGKRNRYILHEGDLSEREIEITLNKILGGDGKFVNIKGGLPDFSFRKI